MAYEQVIKIVIESYSNLDALTKTNKQFNDMNGLVKRMNDEITGLRKKMKDASDPRWQGRYRKQIDELKGGIEGMGASFIRQEKFMKKASSGFAQGLVDNATDINALGDQYDSLGGSLKMTFPEFQKFEKGGGQMNSSMGRLGMGMRMATHGMKGFKMELLSVMFFGQMMSQTMKNLLRPAMETAGVFELLRITLLVLFIPIILLLLPLFLKISAWFMSLPIEIKIMLGVFVILFGIIFAGMALWATVSLFAGGAFVAMIASILVTAFVLAAGISIIFGGIYLIVKGKLEGIGLVIMGIGVILLLFIGWWALIPIAIGLVVYLIIKHWDKFSDFWVNLWNTISYWFEKAWYDIKKFLGFAGDPPIKKALVKTAEEAEDSEKKTGGALDGIMDKFKKSMGQTNSTLVQGGESNEQVWSGSLTNMVGDNAGAWDDILLDTNMGVNAYNAELGRMGTGGGGGAVAYTPSGKAYNVSETSFGGGGGSSSGGGSRIVNTGGSSGYQSGSSSGVSPSSGSGLGTSSIGVWSGTLPKSYSDFIWRPGQSPISISSQDTLVGSKQGGGGGINFSPTYNVIVADKAEFENMIKANNSRMVEDLKRMIRG